MRVCVCVNILYLGVRVWVYALGPALSEIKAGLSGACLRVCTYTIVVCFVKKRGIKHDKAVLLVWHLLHLYFVKRFSNVFCKNKI